MTGEPRAERLSCREAAEMIGVSPRTLERWRTNKRGPEYFAPPGMRPFYLKSDVSDWLAASRVHTDAADAAARVRTYRV